MTTLICIRVPLMATLICIRVPLMATLICIRVPLMATPMSCACRYDALKAAEWEPFPQEWEQVERVVAQRCEAPGEIEYFIKWRQLTYADASWELAEV